MDKKKRSRGDFQAMLKESTAPGVSEERIRELYEIWAETYDEDHASHISHRGPFHVENILSRYLEHKKDSRILDVAAGTGRVGMELKKAGYANVDALDASHAMLTKAENKGCYKNIICDILGKNKLNIDSDSYDAVVTTASFIPGHLNDECFEEVLRIVRPGGFFVLVMRKHYLLKDPVFKDRLEPRMQFIEDKGAWQWLLKEIVFNYHNEQQGIAYVFQMKREKQDYLAAL